MQPGVLDLMHFLAERGVVRALMTRNSTRAAEAFLSHLKEELNTHLHRYPALREQEVFSQVGGVIGWGRNKPHLLCSHTPLLFSVWLVYRHVAMSC